MSSPTPPLRIYNTLTRSKEAFEPIDAGNVRLYACGPTVYDYAHIGNARPLIVFDVLFRLLRQRYGAEHVTYVRNITDVDDKINARAAEENVSIRDLTERTNRVFQDDARALGCLEPTHQPRATDYVLNPDASLDMIRMIARLVETGHAYVADGHVLFSVGSMADYGRLSRRPLDEMIAGARVEVAPYKRADTDFVLWKPSRIAGDGPQRRHRADEPGWNSPWGFGRPGWHLECSAMSAALLGEIFDIHAGGIDLVFPHHENEIAQSRCCFGTPVMANYWMHNGFLQVEGAKMSKSAGNFITVHDLLHTTKFGGRTWSGEVLRLAMLKTHYRQPIDWTVSALEEAENVLEGWRKASRSVEATVVDSIFLTKLANDLDLSGAIARLHSLKSTDPGAMTASAELIGLRLPRTINAGVLEATEAHDTVSAVVDTLSSEQHLLIDERLAARARKDWKESDRIRDELAAMGIALKDNKDGTTTWEMKQ